jgi:hypothetical protein
MTGNVKLGSLSNRASLVNDLFAARRLPDAGIRVVSAVGAKPPLHMA